MRTYTALLMTLALAMLFLMPSCGFMRNVKASIAGTVYMDGRPVSGTVVVYDMNGQEVAQARTTLEGHFIIKGLNPGTYKLRYLNMQGFPFGSEKVVEVRLGRFEQVKIELSSSDRIPIN